MLWCHTYMMGDFNIVIASQKLTQIMLTFTDINER